MTDLTTIIVPAEIDPDYPRTTAFELVSAFREQDLITDAAVLLDFRLPQILDIEFIESVVDYTAELAPERLIVLGLAEAIHSTLRINHGMSAMRFIEHADDLVDEDPVSSPLTPELFEQFAQCELV